MSRLFPAAAFALLLASCSGGGSEPQGGATPREVFEIIRTGFEKQDWASVYDAIAPDHVDRTLYEMNVAVGLTTLNDKDRENGLDALMKVPMKLKPGATLVGDIKEEGDKASARYKEANGKEKELKLVRKNGRWYLAE